MLNERNTLLEDDGIEEEILVEEECSVAQAVWGDIQGNIENQTDLQNALDAKQDSLTEAQLNAVNSGITSDKVTTYDGYADQIASKANQSALNTEATTREQADTALGRRIDDEATARQNADNGLQSQIDAITSQSDVVDVVANYAALQAYDTSSLSDNDVIKVLDDETHEDALTYYRWSTTTQTWSYIGQEAPYYSKGQMDVMLQGKQDKLTAGANIQIQNGTISATDTTYTAGNGLNLEDTEFSADTDVLATKEDLEGYYTKPETDNLLAPKLEAEVVAELPTTGEEGKLYLTPKAHTTQTATGNHITASITDGAGSMESFQLDGDTYQQSYEGKNLFDKDSVILGKYINSSGEIDNTPAWCVSAYIKISPSTNYTISGQAIAGSATRSCYYTANKEVISVFTGGNKTITTPSNAEYMRVSVFTGNQGTSSDVPTYMLELGSSATSYEPYVGGVPSPNPDYPQQIQTVTGEQTVSVATSLITTDTELENSRLNSSGTVNINISNRLCCSDYIEVKPNTTYHFSVSSVNSSKTIQAYFVGYASTNGVGIENYPNGANWANPPFSIITGSNCHYVKVGMRFSDDSDITPNDISEIELLTPATTYPISLGSIELCKLGTYQDYIYKDGENWKIHKSIKKVTPTGEESYSFYEGMTRFSVSDVKTGQTAGIISTHFIREYANNEGKCYVSTGSLIAMGIPNISTEAQAQAWVSANEPEFYCELSNPTDTTITDTNLIAQLEAIRTASLQNGANTITNTATGSNLAGDMEIGYYGFAPRNRYDKWLWLDINNEYEQIGS